MSQQLYELVDPVVVDLGYELWHLECVGPTQERVLRIYIDASGGITLEDCEQVSNEVSSVLEIAQANGVRAADYAKLEVSSPGLDRPLATASHFARFVGDIARVTLFAPVDGQRRFCGVIRSVADEMVELEVDDKIFSLPLKDIAKARLEPVFEA